MRLAYLSGTAIPSRAASALHVVKMCNALAEHCEVTAYGLSGEQASLADYYKSSIHFSYLGFEHSAAPGGGYRFAWRTRSAERKNMSDLYYGRHLNALWFCASSAKPFAYEAHALPRTRHARWLLHRVAAQKNCRAVVCITQLLADDIRPLLPTNTRIQVLADAADIPITHTAGIDAWPGRAEVPQIGYVGHIYPGKGMEMVAALARTSPQWDFHVIGGRDADLQYWRDKPAMSNLFFHGFVKHGELPAYYHHLDLALLPLQDKVLIADGKSEIGRWTSPLKAFEYMAHKIPIVASNTAVLREIFTHGNNAMLVDPADTAAWQSSIDHVVSNPHVAEALVQQAWQQFVNRHTWQHRAQAVLELLN